MEMKLKIEEKDIYIRLDDPYFFGPAFYNYVKGRMTQWDVKGYFKSKWSWKPIWIWEIVKEKEVLAPKKGWEYYYNKVFK